MAQAQEPPKPRSTLFLSGAAFNIFLEMGAVVGEPRFDIHAGTSSGSFVSAALALGYTGETLMAWAEANFQVLTDDLTMRYYRVLTEGALITRAGQQRFISMMIEDSPLYQSLVPDGKFLVCPSAVATAPRIPFAATDLTFSMLRTPLVINATCLDTNRPVIFSPWTTPDASVHFAVMASMALVPLLAPAIDAAGVRYGDGAFIADYAPEMFNPTSALYYKRFYPDAEIPIDLANARGVLIANEKQAPLPAGWGPVNLVRFLVGLPSLYLQSGLYNEPFGVIKERTLTIVPTRSGVTLPTLAEAQGLFRDGMRAGFEQSLRAAQRACDALQATHAAAEQ